MILLWANVILHINRWILETIPTRCQDVDPLFYALVTICMILVPLFLYLLIVLPLSHLCFILFPEPILPPIPPNLLFILVPIYLRVQTIPVFILFPSLLPLALAIRLLIWSLLTPLLTVFLSTNRLPASPQVMMDWTLHLIPFPPQFHRRCP